MTAFFHPSSDSSSSGRFRPEALFRPHSVAVIAALAARGTRAAVVIGGGTALRDLTRQTGMRMPGPRPFGIARHLRERLIAWARTQGYWRSSGRCWRTTCRCSPSRAGFPTSLR